jgi:polysaccharide export outer membrane protein
MVAKMTMKQVMQGCAALVALVAGAALADAQVVTPRTGGSFAMPGNVPQASQAAQTEQADPLPDYRIGIGDILFIGVYNAPSVSGDVAVRPDGKITLPIGDDIAAVNLTTGELKVRVIAALKRWYEDPAVTIVVKAMPSRNVFITGNVNKPGAYPVLASMDIVQLITLAGGLLEFADKKNIILISATQTDAKGQPMTWKVNYEDLSKGRNLPKNLVSLHPGDRVIVR